MKKNLKFLLKNKLAKKEIELIPSSFDVVGSILIFSDFPKELEKKEKSIGEEILRQFRNIKTVAKKTKKYSGKFRTPRLKIIAGEKTKETIHRENNVSIKLDAEKVYFSPRLSGERKRIFNQVKNNESILVMFSGCAAYPLVIAKNSNVNEIYCVEINPTAHKYALENLKLNKLGDKIKLFLGDAKEIVPLLNKKFDRILMPLPKGADKFLDLALGKIRKNGIIHFYDFSEENSYGKVIENIKEECRKQKKRCKIINIVKCGQFSPGVNRICVDFRVF